MSTNIDSLALVQAIRRATKRDEQPVALHEPSFVGNEWNYVKACLDTRWVSSAGAYVDKFERGIESYLGVDHAIAVVNGTAALHICLLVAGVEAGDEVLTPALSFVATANAITYCGAIPHFVDSSFQTLGMDPYKLEDYLKEIAVIRNDRCVNRQTGRRISAVVPMHTFGHPVEMDSLIEVCNRYRLVLVEDAAESLGSLYKGKHTGAFGQVSALSFNGNKIITTGGGGAILTNDAHLAERARHLSTTAKLPHAWQYVHDDIGYNYRMPNINAALGCGQLEQLDSFVSKKRDLAKRYQSSLSAVSEVGFFVEPKDAQSNYWLNVLLLSNAVASQRDSVLERLNHEGIGTRPVWTLMTHLPMYQACPSMNLSVAENLSNRIINLPSSSFLGDSI